MVMIHSRCKPQSCMATSKKPPKSSDFYCNCSPAWGASRNPGPVFYCRPSAGLQTQWFDKRNSWLRGGRGKTPARREGKVLREKCLCGVKMFIRSSSAELSLSVTYLSLSVPHPLPAALGLFISNNHQPPCSKLSFLFFTLIQ